MLLLDDKVDEQSKQIDEVQLQGFAWCSANFILVLHAKDV